MALQVGRIAKDIREVKRDTESPERNALKDSNFTSLKESNFGNHARVHVGNVVSYNIGKPKIL